ncbi:MAG: glycosyltransferase [Deltaproteobacteria bacterium]|uniref:Glycosyltransferase n=1 Tax=Candidatus Zymogenus saltonus TaxID=2844893 RepID=A0A9D8KKF8_9DELT|nr:glycosyltransferase [Candidatus Zymogenus saltonus]
MMLFKLLSASRDDGFRPVVISLMGEDDLGGEIETMGVPIFTMGMRRGRPTPASFCRLVKTMRRIKPDLIQGWMYHGNFAASLAARFLKGRVPVLWNIRQSVYGFEAEKRLTAFLIRFGARLAGSTAGIVYNSIVGAEHHESLGYPVKKRIYIPNGFDCERFSPSSSARGRLIKELGLNGDEVLIGFVSRYHPMKDHGNFLKAASILGKKTEKTHFVLVGRDMTMENGGLAAMVKNTGIPERIHLLGFRREIPEITAGLDIATTSSFTEASPNVIGEAMASGVPCVVTDVGDSRDLVGDTGRVVPPKDPEALAGGWLDLIKMGVKGRKRLGAAARERIVERFSIAAVAEQYRLMYTEVLAGRQGR